MKRKILIIGCLTAALCFSGLVVVDHSSSRVESGILDVVGKIKSKVSGGVGALKGLIVKVVQGLVMLFKQFNEKIQSIGYKDTALKIASKIPLPGPIQKLIGREEIDIGLALDGLPSGAGDDLTEGFKTITAQIEPKIDFKLEGLGPLGAVLPPFNLGDTGPDAISKLSFFFGKVPGLPSSILGKLKEIMVLDGLKVFFIKLLALAHDVGTREISLNQARIEIVLLLIRLQETVNSDLSSSGNIVTYGQSGINGILNKLPAVIRGPVDNMLEKIKIPMPPEEFQELSSVLTSVNIGDVKERVSSVVSTAE